METTKLYVEYVVIGMETLAVILLAILFIVGTDFLAVLGYCAENIVPSVIMLGACYILGLLVDRLSDMFYAKRKEKIKNSYKTKAATSIVIWEQIDNNTFAALTLSRIRLMRSTAVNSFVMTFVCTAAVWKYCGNRWLVFLSFAGFAAITFAADVAHRDLLENYYRKTLELENSALLDKKEKVSV